MKLVSILTSVFNNEQSISECLASLYHQSYSNIEHIIIDNCSTDQSLSILQNFQFKNRTIVSEKDKGLYDAINKGIKLANGEIIGILHADDFYCHSKVIEQVVALFQSDYQGVYANLNYVQRSNTKKIVRKWRTGKYQRSSFMYGWMPPHPTCFVTKSVYEKNGDYRLDMGTAADYEWILRNMYRYKVPFAYLDDYIITMRLGGVSNQNLKSRILANIHDRKAWKVNELKPYWYTLYLKPLRKIFQFFV